MPVSNYYIKTVSLFMKYLQEKFLDEDYEYPLSEDDLSSVTDRICRKDPPYCIPENRKRIHLVLNSKKDVRSFVKRITEAHHNLENRPDDTKKESSESSDINNRITAASSLFDSEEVKSLSSSVESRRQAAQSSFEEAAKKNEEIAYMIKDLFDQQKKILLECHTNAQNTINIEALRELAKSVNCAIAEDLPVKNGLLKTMALFSCTMIEPKPGDVFNTKEHSCTSDIPVDRRKIRSLTVPGWKCEDTVILAAEVEVEEI